MFSLVSEIRHEVFEVSQESSSVSYIPGSMTFEFRKLSNFQH